MTLTEQDGKTTMTTHELYQSPEDRDGMLATGMESGMNESYERLDELVVAEQRALQD